MYTSDQWSLVHTERCGVRVESKCESPQPCDSEGKVMK